MFANCQRVRELEGLVNFSINRIAPDINRAQQNHLNLNLQKSVHIKPMTETHQVIHLNSKKRSQSPHLKNHNSSIRHSASEINFNRIVDIPSPIFGLNEFNDSHSKGRVQGMKSPSRSRTNTNRSFNNNQALMYNSALLKSQHQNSPRVHTLERQENRSFLKKDFQNPNSIAGSQLSQDLTKSQNFRQYSTLSMKTPQKIHRNIAPRQSSKSPQKLNVIRNIDVNDLNSLTKPQNNSQILLNISNKQNHMKISFGGEKYTEKDFRNTQFAAAASTILRNSSSNAILVPSSQINRHQIKNSSQQGFFKNTQEGFQTLNRLSQRFPLNQSNQGNFHKNSEGCAVIVSSYAHYQRPQDLTRNTTPQRIHVHINPKSNTIITSQQPIIRNVSSSPIYKNTAETSTIMAPVQTQQKGQYKVSSISDRERQLIRKVKVLQNRIGELHNQKQNAVLKLRQENHHLVSQNQQLRAQINKLQKQSQKLIDRSRRCELTTQLHERQCSTDRVQEKVSLLDPQQSQFDLTIMNGANFERYPQDDYTQIEQLNQVIDKITSLEERNCQLETLTKNLTIERDDLIQKNQTLGDRVKELLTEQESIREALDNEIDRNAQTIRILNQQKEEYSVTLKNYADELNQLRDLCQKYSQKGLSLSSSGVQTETNCKVNNNNYSVSSCRKCQDLMKTVSKLNSHLNLRR